MSRIRVLDDHTVNKIAAGEVIADPASIVKELIENSIDAGASSIQVEIAGGGFASVRVVDNGYGMSHDDAILCFERHATSKLSTIEDFAALSSMGFRGEALASIAAVAKVEMITAETMDTPGTKVIIHGGKHIQATPCARTPGTSFTISSLFYNTPARKAFQKSSMVSTNDIVKVLTKAALAFPQCGFTLVSQQHTLLDTVPTETFQARIQQTLSPQYTKGIVLELKDDAFYIHGLIGQPADAKTNRSGQHLFINGRPIHSPLIAQAILEAYGTRLEPRRFPIFALQLFLPGDCVDVNVHPQKIQVRFNNDRRIVQFVEKAVSLALQKTEPPLFSVSSPALFSAPFKMDEPPLRKTSSSPYSVLRTSFLSPTPTPSLPKNQEKQYHSIRILYLCNPYVFYLLDEETAHIMHLGNARARLVFDDVLATLKENTSKSIEIEQLLFPETLAFSSHDSHLLEQHLSLLEAIGIALRIFGKHQFIVEGIASFVDSAQVRDMISEFLEHIRKGNTTDPLFQEQMGKLASKYAKNTALILSSESAKRLIEEFYKHQASNYCPQGYRIILPYDPVTLDSLFKR